MPSLADPRPLHLLTTDILLVELISGRAIVTEEGTSLGLTTAEARSALNWYRNHRTKWAGNVMAPDCEAIIDSIAIAAPTLPAAPSLATQAIRRLSLVKIVAHRFAGLHAFGTVDTAPDDFVFEPEKPITLFEGWNGSGKTSLVNAVIWCLTGQLLRPQRLPENDDDDFTCQVERDEDVASEHQITPVTPLPHDKDWTPEESSRSVPADTWVELTFADEEGNILPPIRRTQSRKPNGKIAEVGPEPSALGVSPIAFRLGTTMPGILPFLQIGSKSELGLAIAKLTGLSELVDLAKHAAKAAVRVAGAITTDRKAELDRIDADFVAHCGDLAERISEFPAMMPPNPLPAVSDADAQEKVAALVVHFEALKASGLADARDVLGDVFDPQDPLQRADLVECIAPALEQLKKLGTLPSIARLGSLKLDPLAADQVRERLAALHAEAETLAELAQNPVRERRVQLYARVATWMREQKHLDTHDCAVCRHSLDGVIDPDTGIAVTEHLAQCRDDAEIVAKTIGQWSRDWTGSLSRDLPEMLRGEILRDLPGVPADLLHAGLSVELFETEPFCGTLSALKPATTALIDGEIAALPAFDEPSIVALPARVAEGSTALVQMVARIERALAFADWMNSHSGALRTALERVRGGLPKVDEAPRSEEADGSVPLNGAIGAKLERLNTIVTGVAPITAAVTLTERMATTLISRAKKLERIAACAKAEAALNEIMPVGALAHAQVEGLRRQLHGRAEYWRDQIYQNATTFAPQPQQSGMNAQGVIDIHVGRGTVRAPAQHVSNASALRASLTGFYLAFREHVLATSGGLTTLVLDDPQDLLDYDNRQRLARGMTKLAAEGAQILATTHDRGFGRALVAEARSDDLIAHRAVHPVNVSRSTIETSLAVDELDRKRLAFINSPDDASHAQDYANQARVFIEARLGDLFDDPAYPAHAAPTRAPTLVPLFDRLRALVSARSNELFKSPILATFCSDAAMAPGAEARRVLNQAHHDKASISYIDVERVDADLRRLRQGVERVHGEFRRHRWREPLTQEPSSNVVALVPVAAPTFNVPICEDIAAFTGHLPSEGQAAHCELLSHTWFDDKALFFVRRDTFGFAIPSGSVAVVEAEPSSARDHSLVIARRSQQVFARRLLRPRNGEGFTLAAEATDPRESRATLAFEDHGVELHRVVGALLSHLPPPAGREEAAEISGDPVLAKIEVAYRVRENSAVPFALPGQVILGGGLISVAELARNEGRIVAVTLDDGTSILKRIGRLVSPQLPYLRQFETIGGLGDSLVIATEPVAGAPRLPVMAYARAVIGVLYDV